MTAPIPSPPTFQKISDGNHGERTDSACAYHWRWYNRLTDCPRPQEKQHSLHGLRSRAISLALPAARMGHVHPMGPTSPPRLPARRALQPNPHRRRRYVPRLRKTVCEHPAPTPPSLLTTPNADPYFEPPDPGVLPTYNGATGALLKNVPLLRMYRVSRRKFRAHCATGIAVAYNKSLSHITYPSPATVTAAFADGSSATGTLLIGADGAQSGARTQLLGAERGRAASVPFRAVNLHVRYGDAAKAAFVRGLHPIMAMGIHPDGYWLWISIQDVPDPDDPATWTFQLQTTWRRGEEEEEVVSLAGLKKRAETFGEPFRSANLWIPEGTKVYENRLSYWEPVPWDNKGGRIVLAGDAAHPMTFQRGQGLNHGIADASKLTKCLKAAVTGETTWQAAIDEYQAEMIDRAGDEVRTSLENTYMLHDWSRMQDSPIMQRGGNPREKQESRQGGSD